MKLLRSELKSEFNKKIFDMSARELPDRGTTFYDDRITCELSVKVVQFGFQLSGFIKTIVSYQCVRCLCYNPKELVLPIKLWLSSKEIPTENDYQDIVHFPENIDHVDLNDMISDIIHLAEPMNPNCSDHCKGLCHNCGINLNQSSCDCKIDNQDNHDNPWDVLKQF